MRSWLLTAPRWALCVVSGVLFGGLWALQSRVLGGESWTSSLLGGVFGGLFFGLVFGWWLHRAHSDVRSRIGTRSVDEVRAAVKQAGRGVAPDDPAVRAAALGMVESQRELLRRQHLLQLLIWPVFIVLAVWLALTTSPWWWLAVPYFGGFLALGLLAPRRLDRQARVLRGGPPPP